ncbi:TonB family protein (plasmid) [Nitrobacteraceae bacterium UC4446_H13]
MIDWRDPDGRPGHKITRPSVLRWTVAVALVVAIHGAAAWLALHWRPEQAVDGGPPEAVMIELAPLAVAPEPTVADVAPGPQVTETPPDPVPDPPEKPPEETRETPASIVEEAAKPLEETPEPTPPPQVEIPKLPEKEKAEAVLPPPPEVQKQERKKPPPKRTVSPRTSAPSVRAQQRADRIAAPTSSAAQVPAAAVATWRSTLMAHLNRNKRFPPGATQGVASVVFTIDRGGRVVSARLARSSGDRVLDAEAVALARRASPVPAPPAGMGGRGTLSISVPIRFDRR